METEVESPNQDVVQAWQSLVDTLARAVEVPAALIMRLTGEEIEVFVSSETEGNPYAPGDREHFFDSGLYCETVIKTGRELLEQFRNVAEAELGMVTIARDLERKNRKLEAALDEVRKLRSIIPLCMGCKKVRDDDGYWSRLEAYLLTHENIMASHALCPECAEQWEEELDREAAGSL